MRRTPRLQLSSACFREFGPSINFSSNIGGVLIEVRKKRWLGIDDKELAEDEEIRTVKKKA